MEAIEIMLNKVVAFMVSFGPLGGFFLVLLESIFPPLPLGVIIGLNILSFGNVLGFFISYIATVIGSMLSFLAFRYLFRDTFNNWFNKKDKKRLTKFMNKLSSIKFETLVILLALPITPAFILNIAAGLSNISYKKYLTALIVGKPAMLLITAYIAVSLAEAIKNPIAIIKVIIMTFLTYVISKVIEKVVKVES